MANTAILPVGDMAEFMKNTFFGYLGLDRKRKFLFGIGKKKAKKDTNAKKKIF